MMHRVLVTDGEQRAALAVVRSLGRAGHDVFVCSSRDRSLAGASRFAKGQALTPDPLLEAPAYVAAVRELVSRWGITALVPTTEAALLSLLPERRSFPGVLVPFPELDDFTAICDKARLLEEARAVGLETPRQWVIPGPGAIAPEVGAKIAFPVALKPARSIGEADGERQKTSVSYARDRDALVEALARAPRAAFPMLVQQRIVGPGVGIFILLWDDEVRAVGAHRRLREKPPAGGVSVYRESIAPDPELVAKAVALLRRFHWRGVAMVEFKADAATGTPYVMEVNGRFWGSLQLAIDSGVDFPALLLEAASGVRRERAPVSRPGVRSRWWWGDVDHLLTRFRRTDEELALPPDAPSRWRSALEFCAVWRPGDRNEILQSSDPRPFFRETYDWFRDLSPW